MIDIWMIFTMTFPLLEVTLHTYKETLKMRMAELGGGPDSLSTFVKVRPNRVTGADPKEGRKRWVMRRGVFCQVWPGEEAEDLPEPPGPGLALLRPRCTICDTAHPPQCSW